MLTGSTSIEFIHLWGILLPANSSRITLKKLFSFLLTIQVHFSPVYLMTHAQIAACVIFILSCTFQQPLLDINSKRILYPIMAVGRKRQSRTGYKSGTISSFLNYEITKKAR